MARCCVPAAVRALLVAVVLVAGPFATGASATLSGAVSRGVSASPARLGDAVVDRSVRDPRISESSGLALSLRHPGVLWTHDDSGNPPVLFALGPDGAVVAALRLRDVADVDWEAMASYRDADGHAVLAVADTGDNGARRASVEIVLVAEPARLRDATVSPSRRLRLRYPDGAADAEALLVDAGADAAPRRMYVVTKGLGSTVYQVPEAVWPGPPEGVPQDEGTLEPIATVPLILVTDGVMGPGHHPVLRTYGELAVLPPITPDVVGGTLEPLATSSLPAQRQGEGLALTGSGEVLLSSEGVGEPILRLPLPGALAAAVGPRPAATPAPGTASGSASGSASVPGTGTGTGTASGTAGSGRVAADGDGVPAVVLLAGAAVPAAVVGAGIGTLQRRRRVRR